MTKLCVNIDHVATIRQARRAALPDPVEAAALCESAGAAGITIHLREDRRHIGDSDLARLRKSVTTFLNLEMATSEEIIAIALDQKPGQITLVPERREEITTEGGLDVAGDEEHLTEVIARFHQARIPVSLFIDPSPRQIEAAARVGAGIIELHTGRYCNAQDPDARRAELRILFEEAAHARRLGITVNAGHGLDYKNVVDVAAIEGMNELNIGHSIVGRAVMVGMDRAVREMLDLVAQGNAKAPLKMD